MFQLATRRSPPSLGLLPEILGYDVVASSHPSGHDPLLVWTCAVDAAALVVDGDPVTGVLRGARPGPRRRPDSRVYLLPAARRADRRGALPGRAGLDRAGPPGTPG